MAIALRKAPIGGVGMASLWPQRYVRRRRRVRILRRLLFAVGMVVGVVVVAGLVWGIVRVLNEE
tara:strand:- start:303 stop:494 length:192 start_codon:yes stop_codon:yes gene_type:complete